MGTSTSADYFVVLDTNIWVYKTMLLGSPIGASLLYTMTQRSVRGMIGLPEVVEKEVIKHALKLGLQATEKVASNLNILKSLTGSYTKIALPKGDQLRQTVYSRLRQLEKLIERVEITPDHLKSALDRLMNEIPPNSEKNQQYKDSLIWEAAIDLSKRAPVYFITGDYGFFENHKPGNGLASVLAKEVSNLDNPLCVYCDIPSFLEDQNVEVPDIDPCVFVRAIELVAGEKIRQVAYEQELSVGPVDVNCSKISAFQTGHKDRIALRFDLLLHASTLDSGDNGSSKGYLQILGESLVSVSKGNISMINPEIRLIRLVDERLNRHPERHFTYTWQHSYGVKHIKLRDSGEQLEG